MGSRPGKLRPKKASPAEETRRTYSATPSPGPRGNPPTEGASTCESAPWLRLCSGVIETDRRARPGMLLVSSDPFMASWERKRQPDDVPTPVAVAVSDFCRRAGTPAAPREIREALSTVSEADDFRVRAVTDAEPPVRPLGPFAVIDLARGTPADMAALRERSGYYGLVEELLALQDASLAAPAPEPALPPLATAPRAVAATPAVPPADARTPPARRTARDETAAPTVAERIA